MIVEYRDGTLFGVCHTSLCTSLPEKRSTTYKNVTCRELRISKVLNRVTSLCGTGYSIIEGYHRCDLFVPHIFPDQEKGDDP